MILQLVQNCFELSFRDLLTFFHNPCPAFICPSDGDKIASYPHSSRLLTKPQSTALLFLGPYLFLRLSLRPLTTKKENPYSQILSLTIGVNSALGLSDIFKASHFFRALSGLT